MKSNPAFSFSGPGKPLSILDRLRPAEGGLTSTQSTVDLSIDQWVENASDWKSIAAMTAGGLAYRWAKTALLSSPFSAFSRGTFLQSLLHGGSVAFGLASEVGVFEVTNRTFQTFCQSPSTDSLSPQLWAWSGPHGWREGLISSFITFGTFKGIGRFAAGQNIFLSHGAQDLGMVLSHELLLGSKKRERPEESFAEKLLHAEITNLQMGAGMSLGNFLTGGKVFAFERNLDLYLQVRESPIFESDLTPKGNGGSLLRNPLIYPLWTFLGAGGIGGVPPVVEKPSPLHFEKRTENYYQTPLDFDLMTKEPIEKMGSKFESIKDSFLDLLVSGEDDRSLLQGEIAQILRENYKTYAPILRSNRKVVVRLDLDDRKILSFKVFEGDQLKIDLSEAAPFPETPPQETASTDVAVQPEPAKPSARKSRKTVPKKINRFKEQALPTKQDPQPTFSKTESVSTPTLQEVEKISSQNEGKVTPVQVVPLPENREKEVLPEKKESPPLKALLESLIPGERADHLGRVLRFPKLYSSGEEVFFLEAPHFKYRDRRGVLRTRGFFISPGGTQFYQLEEVPLRDIRRKPIHADHLIGLTAPGMAPLFLYRKEVSAVLFDSNGELISEYQKPWPQPLTQIFLSESRFFLSQKAPREGADSAPSSKSIGSTLLEKIGQFAMVRQIGRGAGQLGRRDRAPGVRAERLREGSENYLFSLFQDFTKPELDRLKRYKKLIESAFTEASEAELSDRLTKIYSDHESDLLKGGFLSPFQVRRVLLENFPEDALWEAMVDSLVLMKMPFPSTETEESEK